MGLIVSYTQISKESFKDMEKKILSKKSIGLEVYEIDEFYIENSFLGLKYVLIKGLGDKMDNIFGGGSSLCSVDYESEDFKKLSPDEQFEIFDRTPEESFLSPSRIHELYELVKQVDEEDIGKWYSSEGLNKANVYPEVWSQDEDENRIYNLRDIKKCFLTWRNFITKVNASKTDYIIVR